MTLLDHYLNVVGAGLPKGSDRPDILAELRGHLESNMDERAAELGRPLTESEQEAVLADFGDPFTVAKRYGRKAGRGVAFGPFQLISPDWFPVHGVAILFVLTINVIVGLVEVALTGASFAMLVRERALNILGVLVVITLTFAGVDFFLRRSGKRQRGSPESWLFYTPYLKYVPKWYSASGLACLSAVAVSWGLWWGVWPDVAHLIVGPAVDGLELAPSWQRLQWCLFALLLVGVGQRAFSLVRPDLNSLPWAVRLVLNTICVALLYPIFASAPFVLAPDAAAAGAATLELAQRINGATQGLLRGFGIYWVVNMLWIALVCAGHLAYYRHGRRLRAVGKAEASSSGGSLLEFRRDGTAGRRR
ncbi:MAG TPA: hypothetical protein VE907_10625 [Gammaproteobacteria bacterium]|nr:hypothetical protein [Gammaproteobacteria bacterium]